MAIGVVVLLVAAQANAQKLLVVNPNCTEGELISWPGWTQVTTVTSAQFLSQGCSGGYDVVEIGCIDSNITSPAGAQLVNNLVQTGVGLYSIINDFEDASWVPGGVTSSGMDGCTDNVSIPPPAFAHPIITFPTPDLTLADFAPVSCAVHGSFAGTSAAYDAILASNDTGLPVILASNSFPGRVLIRGHHHHFLGDPGAVRLTDSIANWLLGGTISGGDADSDGVPDSCDNCPGLSNPGQQDSDLNGVGDACNDGEDSDGDEWADDVDNCPALSNPDQADADFDGVGDLCDTCFGAGPDADGDGFCDSSDNCPAVANPGQEDSDFDGVGNACDTCFGFGSVDTDSDGRCDNNDNCPSVANPNQADSDFSGIGNACNDALDADGDEFENLFDNCPNVSNPTQVDGDFDNIGDACDTCVGPGSTDSDGDTLCNPVDNCPTIANLGQEDTNDDGIGDACSPQVSIGPITSDGSNHTATVIASSPVNRPLSGTARVCGVESVTALSFTWLATRCSGSESLALTVNGVVVASRPVNPNPPVCSCTPGIGTYAVPIGAVQPLIRAGENRFGIRTSNTFNTITAWAYATLTTVQGQQRVEIFDAQGGNSYDQPDLCAAGSTSGLVNAAAAVDLCDEVASENWAGTLPCALDVSGAAPGEYRLEVTATDGVVGSPSSDEGTFLHDGESNLFINSNCGLGCDEMTDQCISVCPAGPRIGCKTAGKSLLIRRKTADGSKDKLFWRWRRGEATTVHEFGNPDDTADYVLCLYAGSTGALIPGGQIVVPKSSNWHAFGGSGWTYGDDSAAADGVRKLTLIGSGQDKARASLKGNGVNLPDPSLPLPPATFPLVVQLLNSETSTCLESTFESGDVTKNNEGNLKARH